MHILTSQTQKAEGKMKEKNTIIRTAQRDKRMYGYEVARLLKVSESTFGRMMRNELPKDEQKRIADLILKSKGE